MFCICEKEVQPTHADIENKFSKYIKWKSKIQKYECHADKRWPPKERTCFLGWNEGHLSTYAFYFPFFFFLLLDFIKFHS